MTVGIFPVPFSGIQETLLDATGDIVYALGDNIPTRLAIGSTNQVLGVTGGVPAYQASSKSTLTTTGDILYASSANTPARLAIGSTDQILKVTGGVPVWGTAASGGGMTLLSTTTLSGASVTLSSIPASYNHLQFFVVNMKPSSDAALQMAFNADTTGFRTANHPDGGNNVNGSTFGSSIAQITAGMDSVVAQGLIWGNIPFYANSTTWKFVVTESLNNDSTTSTSYRWSFYTNFYNQTEAISSLLFSPDSGASFTSGTLYLYGVK